MTVMFVVMTILILLALDVVVRRARTKKAVPVTPAHTPALAYPVRLPDGIFFARSHTWMSLLPSGKIRLGIDDFVIRLLDSLSISYLKGPRERLQKGEPILVLREGDHSLTIRAPIEGEILERNDRLSKEPNMLKEMLFTDGWAYTIVPARHSDLKQLLLGEETRPWIAEEFCRLRDLFARKVSTNKIVPSLLQDGGPPADGALKSVQRQTWEQFDHMFLRETG